MGFNGCVQVLLDALAFRLDGILRHIIAQSAHGGLAFFVTEHTSIVPAADYEIGMAGHLTHARDQTEDIGVICSCAWMIRCTVEQCSSIDVRAEFPLCIRKEAQVQFLLLWAEVIAPHNDRTRRKAQFVCPLNLRPLQHDSVQ